MGWFSRKKTKKLPPNQGEPLRPSNAKPAPPCPQRPYQGQPPPSHHHVSQTSGITGTNTAAGYLPPPPGWNDGLSHRPHQQQQNTQQTPVVVNQHYYLLPAPQSDVMIQRPHGSEVALSNTKVGSTVSLAIQIMPGPSPVSLDDGPLPWNSSVQQGAAATDHMYQRFGNVMTLIDQDRYAGDERELFVCHSDASSTPSSTAGTTTRGQLSKPKKHHVSSRSHHDSPKGQATAVAASMMSGSYFAKVELYANSRLPMNLPPLKLYIPTWPLLCLAAQYSDRVYDKARGAEKDVHVNADQRGGARATVIKSVPMDHMNTIVFAIRGTATFMDWAVNLDTEPTSPAGFLDDAGNYCHGGFLKTARRMVKPVARRLRQLLDEDPRRSSYSLLITGHSAGGAVASLLYAHMLSSSPAAASELSALAGRFRRVHCVTFGAPPVSLLPLRRPDGRPGMDTSKSLFLAFVNEGDPVARADKAYVRSLVELLARPAPVAAAPAQEPRRRLGKPLSPALLLLPACPAAKDHHRSSRSSVVSARSSKSSKASKPAKSSRDSVSAGIGGGASPPTGAAQGGEGAPVWKVPACTLSNAGRIVVLRSGNPTRLRGKKTVEERLNEGVVAQVATDEQLRGVVWGNPVCHVMKLYAGRLEILAVAAVTARGY